LIETPRNPGQPSVWLTPKLPFRCSTSIAHLHHQPFSAADIHFSSQYFRPQNRLGSRLCLDLGGTQGAHSIHYSQDLLRGRAIGAQVTPARRLCCCEYDRNTLNIVELRRTHAWRRKIWLTTVDIQLLAEEEVAAATVPRASSSSTSTKTIMAMRTTSTATVTAPRPATIWATTEGLRLAGTTCTARALDPDVVDLDLDLQEEGDRHLLVDEVALCGGVLPEAPAVVVLPALVADILHPLEVALIVLTPWNRKRVAVDRP
jgi:hypothetical protein